VTITDGIVPYEMPPRNPLLQVPGEANQGHRVKRDRNTDRLTAVVLESLHILRPGALLSVEAFCRSRRWWNNWVVDRGCKAETIVDGAHQC
jgi:hypothetical protein